jgi:methionine-rich copper-binding protein CopC
VNAGSDAENTPRWELSRRSFLKRSAVTVGLAASAAACELNPANAVPNAISAENALPGTTDDWEPLYLDDAVEGFATQWSVNAGETVDFKIKTAASAYAIKIYRIGYYGGVGARRVAVVTPSATLPQIQPAPYRDDITGLVDCSNWAVSASWTVPTSAVSGVYVANLELLDGSGSRNRIMFVVRRDDLPSEILVQTSDTTYQAYNRWGGNSLYTGSAFYGRATKVSYNRPYDPSELENDFFYAEYPLIRWLERNGFHVAYCGGADVATRPAQLLNRKIFISSGHDEYWSGAARANIEAARNAGVSLVFMTGNEVFWRVRWEPSPVDSSSHRTLVCYKETLNGAKIDPTAEWTGTWRDARFSPPAVGGGAPENGLTGTLFKAINPVGDADFAIKVPSSYSRLRFWRYTSIATQAPGAVATLSPATLGYEWNTDEDNDARPAGLIRLSETTEVATQVLQDEGGTYIEAPLTHYMTMYRAPSGALVWSTGTVQWSWGLDASHTNRPDVPVPTDVRIQQATLNALIDMGAYPATVHDGIISQVPSREALPPTAALTAPLDRASGPVGSPVIVSGTAADSGGGVVAAVEVSTDGGASWHPAVGTTTWSYSFVPTQLGSTTILARAVDDSCNIGPATPARTFTGVTRVLPAAIWPNGTVPRSADSGDPSPIEAGVRFTTELDGFVTALRFHKSAANVGQHTGRLWSNTGTLLGTVQFRGETASGWQRQSFTQPIPVFAGVAYVASYTAPNGHYSADAMGLANGYALHPLRALAPGAQGPNGVFGSVGSFPTSTFGSANYWVDIEFNTDNGVAPVVVDSNPARGVSSVDLAATVTAVFNEAMQPGTVQLTVTGPGGPIAGTVTVDANRSFTFDPASPLDPDTEFVVDVAGGIDFASTPMAADSWTFRTAGAVGALPTSVWTSANVPAVASNPDSAIEVGLRFSSAVDGIVRSIRFYKGAGNSGLHVGHLWDFAGNLLGTAMFSNESASGWQEAPLDVPVTIAKNQVYVVSYLAPAGGYAVTAGMFTSGGVSRGPLRALGAPEVGANGVFRYGAGGGYPTASFGNANYWVDLVMEAVPDIIAPAVVNAVPAPGIIAVSTTQPIVVTFDAAVQPASLVFELRAGATLVPATVTFADAKTVVLAPSASLALGTEYTASILATDLSNNAMIAPYEWSFVCDNGTGVSPTTLWTTSTVPPTPAANDAHAVEVGVKIRVDASGSIAGLRFYKGPGNDGPHVGHLWSAEGVLLGSTTFTNESAEGWQQSNFATPIPVVAGTLYVASYHAPAGRYSFEAGGLSQSVTRTPASGTTGGNGVYAYGASRFPTGSGGGANYFIDVVYDDDAAPTVTSHQPARDAVDVALSTAIVVRFNEAVVDAGLVVEVRDAGGGLVPTTLARVAADHIEITPNAGLSSASIYTASVVSAFDSSGNSIAAPYLWSFTTVDTSLVTLFGNALPAGPSNDPAAIEVGMKFRTTAAAELLGIRFYRGPGNTGAQVGHLWTAAGVQVAEVTFATGGSDGWQLAMLATPIALNPNETYVVSYLAPTGNYSVTPTAFNAGDIVNGVLVGQGNAPTDPNGVFVYGGGFPTQAFAGTNYWVDVFVRVT